MGPISPEKISIQSFNGFLLTSHNECHWASLLELIRKGTLSPAALKEGFTSPPAKSFLPEEKKKKEEKRKRKKKGKRFHCSLHLLSLRTDFQFVNFLYSSGFSKGREG